MPLFKGERHADPIETVFVHLAFGKALGGFVEGIHGLQVQILLQQADAFVVGTREQRSDGAVERCRGNVHGSRWRAHTRPA